VNRKSISTNAAAIQCDVCGRTLLRGEQHDVFFHGGERRNVCELCTARAVHEGWIREGLDDVIGRGRERRPGRGGSLLSRLRQRRESPTSSGRAQPEARDRGRYAEHDDEHAEPEFESEFEDGPTPAPAPEPVVSRPPPDTDLYKSRSVRGVPTNAELKVARALELFNASRHPRTVFGVGRSLGAPIVSARPSSTEGSVVGIVVAWELSWYRYEVDLGDEAAGVRVVAQGMELTELDETDQTPNAAADDQGRLHLAAPVS
jgi:hypothetical protein